MVLIPPAGGAHWKLATPFVVGMDPLIPVVLKVKATVPGGNPLPITPWRTVGSPTYRLAGHRIARGVDAEVELGFEIGLVDPVKAPLSEV